MNAVKRVLVLNRRMGIHRHWNYRAFSSRPARRSLSRDRITDPFLGIRVGTSSAWEIAPAFPGG